MTRPPARGARLGAGLLVLGMGGCGKVGFVDVNAAFTRADVAWFEEEQTLFVFYEVRADQGIGDPSLIEISWVTDDARVDWTPLEDFTPVHRHVRVDCGPQARCGSWSIAVPDQPRDVDLRLRYHHDGELALEAQTTFNRVGRGSDHTNRSLVVYGVFDASNSFVQWRGRHQFPTLRNEEASALGLRRWFEVADTRYGRDGSIGSTRNPYAYGVPCTSTFPETGLEPVETDERAVFHPTELPVEASRAALVCGTATVTDALGPYESSAWARKNPEVRPAFPTLRSPIREATAIPFFLAPCDRRIDAKHEAMQRQRLLLGDLRATCIDDWDQAGFADQLAATFQDAVEETRAGGDDMVLVIGLHRDTDGMARVVEEALAKVVPEERHWTSPRLAGAFVFDSDARAIEDGGLDPVTLWCPSTLTGGVDPTAPSASLLCAIAPDNPDFELGPFTFGTLPILPSRDQYLDFIDTYSENQAGKMLSYTLRAPEFAATSDHVDLGTFGVATFLNDERFGADARDAFSYCSSNELKPVVFRTPFMESEAFQAIVAELCTEGALPRGFCQTGALGLLPLQLLPEYHSLLGENKLGIAWDFPFLLRMRFETVAAGSLSALGFSLPFGFAGNGQQYLGTQIWRADAIDLSETLTHCERFCDHPVFGSAGVYRVLLSFRDDFATSCYNPDYPAPGDGGFPVDP